MLGEPAHELSVVSAQSRSGRDVVEGQHDGGDTKADHLVHLGRQCGPVVGVVVTDGQPRGQREGHRQGVGLHQGSQVGQLVGVIGLAPAGPVLGVVLGCVDVVVHAPPVAPGHHLQTLGGGPWRAVEALDDSEHRCLWVGHRVIFAHR